MPASEDTRITGLRQRIAGVLKSKGCNAIRFKLENITISRYMYNYLAGEVESGRLNVAIGNGDHFDPDSRTIQFDNGSPLEATIVHECTHALIATTHGGKYIFVGAHEAAAYLAESIYKLTIGRDVSTDTPHLDRPLRSLAKLVIAHNATHPNGLFVCKQSDAMYIASVLEQENGQNINQLMKQ